MEKIRIPKLKVMFYSLIIFSLNEFIYYNYGLSFFVNLLVLTILIIMFLNKSDEFIYLLSIFSLVVNTRPREIHTLPIDMRGMFEYYSLNIQKLGLFSFSTTAIVFFSISLTALYIKDKQFNMNVRWLFVVLFMSALMTVVYAIDTQSMDLLKGTQSIRYCIILIGAFAFARYYISNKVFNDNLFIEKLVINVLTTSILVSFFNILMDLVTGDFKLRYTTSTVCFAAMIFYVALNKNYSFRIRLLLPVVSAMLLFPITRGEQLILAMTFMIYIYLSFGKNQNTSFKDYFSSKVTLVLSIVGLSIALNYVAIYLPDTWQMLAHKFSFFVSGDIKIDQSSSVRIEEYVAILRVDDWKSAFYLLFGKGWLGTFSFPTDFVSSLEQTDFALIDIYNNRFYSPHSFLGFHILKFGLIGSVLLFYLILNSVNLKNREINQSSELSLLLLPAIFYIGYFNPTFLFISMSILFSQVIVARGSSK